VLLAVVLAGALWQAIQYWRTRNPIQKAETE
jgi:hypothetical protein